MNADYIYIGATPCDEDCEPVGGNIMKMKKECRAYINQLRRVYGKEPNGAHMSLRKEEHDFGIYYEVICAYTTQDGMTYALKLESGCENWDQEARIELLAEPKQTFDEWKKLVEKACIHCYFLGCDDLPDQPYYDMYEEGLSPKEAVERFEL